MAPTDLLEDLIARAQKAGADTADAVMFEAAALSVNYRLGKLEEVERSESHDLGLRVMIGQRQAMVSSNDSSATAVAELVTRAVDMARAAPEDPYCGLADDDLLENAPPDLDLYDAAEPTAEALSQSAAAAEEAARAVAGVTNSNGGGASWSSAAIALATSRGFTGAYRTSSFGIGVSVVAGEGQSMETDYDHHSARHLPDLEAAAAIGRRAGERAVRRLNPRKLDTIQAPVIFDPRVAGSLLGHLSSAITGPAVARGTSFLRDKMEKSIFAPGIRIVDDPRRPRGLRSKPFDGEGAATRRHDIIEDGRLTTWLLDSASARQLGLKSTGHASRGTSSPPSPSTTNLYLAPGALSREALISEAGDGLYVTDLIGFGVNALTGDYSRGASGFWIENGQIAYPVSEITIAGNLIGMFASLTPADDLEFRHGTNAPTVRIDGMTIAGN